MREDPRRSALQRETKQNNRKFVTDRPTEYFITIFWLLSSFSTENAESRFVVGQNGVRVTKRPTHSSERQCEFSLFLWVVNKDGVTWNGCTLLNNETFASTD